MLRPWRVGLIIDTKSPAEVRDAIASLSSVWGGVSMPIFDKNAPIADLETAGTLFDVDSLHADHADGPLADLLRKPGWAWRRFGSGGPFGRADDGPFRKGLLLLRELLDSARALTLPGWEADHPADLALAAIWGVIDELNIEHATVPLASLVTRGDTCAAKCGVLSVNALGVTSNRSPGHDEAGSLYVLRSDHPEDIVDFWNLRARGSRMVGIPCGAGRDLVDFLLSQPLPIREVHVAGAGTPSQELGVIGLENASAEVAAAIRDVASRTGLTLAQESSPGGPSFVFSGSVTPFTRSIRADFRPESRWIDIDLPRLPMIEQPDVLPYSRGIVAAEVELRNVHHQDPRFAAQIPPYRRHAALVENLPFVEDVEHIRCGYDGLVLGIDAEVQEVRIPFAYNLDILRLLFDDASVTADQSDVGKFQTRAAEKFGGPFGGVFNQPGVRAAVLLAAGKPSGITLSQLRNVVERQRGGWPDPVMESRVTPRDYATHVVNDLFYSGLFVPTLRVHCSSCRVESYVSAEQLGSIMLCEFCGESFSLALSQSLSKPEWRYRLAAHLRGDQVEALMPALATTSLLQQLRFASDPPPLMLGFRVAIGGRVVEVDIAAYLGDRQHVAVLGEVKNRNRIDSNDIANLEFLRARLRDKGVRCLLLFATMKDRFSAEETVALRSLTERSALTEASMGGGVLDVPMVLTGRDLSRSFWDKNHPWRWANANRGGIFETAMLSCERNLGLRQYARNRSAGKGAFSFEWEEVAGATLDGTRSFGEPGP
jgi:hypothetical protein